MRTARHSQQRGAASVEAAISMLIIIPAFMYALFLDDLHCFILDGARDVSNGWRAETSFRAKRRATVLYIGIETFDLACKFLKPATSF